MQHVRGRYVIFVDADGATRFEDLQVLEKELKAVERDGLGVAVGSRAHMVHSAAVVQRSFIRNFTMYGFHAFLHFIGVRSIKDTQCGFKLFTRRACELIFPSMHVERWAFDVECLYLAERQRIPMVEVPVTWHEVRSQRHV
jgi:dolichyl-phosphate beta-glucosyltransferase